MDKNLFSGRKPSKRGWGASVKNIVFGMYQRNGKVLIFLTHLIHEDNVSCHYQ